MIEATIRIWGEDQDVTDGPCKMPAIPQIGGHITVIDRNSNHQVLRVLDVVIGAVSVKMLERLPNTAPWGLNVRILCEETLGHPFELPPE